MTVPHIVLVSYLSTAAVGGIGLMLMTVGEQVAWMLCLGTVGVLSASTFILKRIDVRKSVPSVLAPRVDEGPRTA
jgi:hypothetical protein